MPDLTRRNLLKGAGAAATALAATRLSGPAGTLLEGSARASTAAAWNHDPASPTGPTHWGDIGYPVCGAGTHQSPINLDRRGAGDFHGSPLLLRYEVSELAIENTGHVVEVVIPEHVADTLQIAGDTYTLSQYHFHAPSEHTIGGHPADVEAHFVHTNAQGATAVVGALYRLGGEPNALLDRVLLAAPPTAGEEAKAGEASPAELLDDLEGVKVKNGLVTVDSFYRYSGSLTTPGCTENVLWSVLAEGGRVSKGAVTRFHQLISEFPGYGGYPNNNRPLQPLNGRAVALRRASEHDGRD
jgi:carbonic anhydrase